MSKSITSEDLLHKYNKDYYIIKKDGYKWQIRPASHIGNCLQDMLGPNDREEYNFAVLQHYANTTKLFIDIGAMVGGFSIKMSNRYKRVLAFEPEPYNFEGLQRNVALNNLQDKVICYPIALGSYNGKEKISKHGGTSRFNDLKNEDGNDVPIVRLDSIKLDSKVTIIKIDTEGYELEVLKGALGLLISDKPKLLIETHENTYEGELVGQTDRIYNFLESLGYKIKVLHTVKNKDKHLYCY